MVKQFSDTLIRLHDPGTLATKSGLIFDNNFNTDIEILPGAQIALCNISMPYSNKQLVVTGNNAQLAFKVTGSAGGAFPTCEFPHRPDGVDKNNFTQFFRDTSDRMNAFLRSNNQVNQQNNTKQTGMRIFVGQNEQNQVTFDFLNGGTTLFDGTKPGALQKIPGGNEFVTRPRRVATETERTIKKLIPGAGAGGSTTSLDISAGTQVGYIAHTQPICTGCGFYHAQIYNLEFDATAGVGDICGLLIGLTDDLDKINADTLSDADLNFAIRIQQPKRTNGNKGSTTNDPTEARNQFNVKTSKAGVFQVNAGGFGITDTEISALSDTGNTAGIGNNPYVGFVVEGDPTNTKTLLKFIYYEHAGGGQFNRRELAVVDLDIRDNSFKDKKYYPVISVLGTDKFKNSQAAPNGGAGFVHGEQLKHWGRVAYNPDPFHLFVAGQSEHGDSDIGVPAQSLTLPIPATSQTFTNFEIDMHPEMASFLGFQSEVLTQRAVQASFVADAQFKPSHNADMYIVEPLNIPLKSYDGLEINKEIAGGIQQFGRRNVLYYVPEAESILNEESGIVQYEPDEKIFLDIQNKQTMLLRNIKIRVTDQFYQPIGTVGPSELIIVVRNYPGVGEFS